jgi:predicted N-formylglutamate amidohydrolase
MRSTVRYRSSHPPCIIVTCEHAANALPPGYEHHLREQDAQRHSHRGWDPGAAELGQALAKAAGARFFSSEYTRLLVDLNRSIGHPALHAEVLRRLPPVQRDEIVARFYRPHRAAIIDAVEACTSRGVPVVHVASHSFTPELDATVRNADVAWLYDPRRPMESRIVARWREALNCLRPELRLRRNYPYVGIADGLTTLLRKRFDDTRYAGIELEINQRFVIAGGADWTTLQRDVVRAFIRTLEHLPDWGSH